MRLQKISIKSLAFAIVLGFVGTSCSKEELQPQERLEIAEKNSKTSQTFSSTDYRNGELVRTQNNVVINQTNSVAVFKVSTLTMRNDFTFFPTVHVVAGSINMYAIYKVNGQTKFISTTRSNVTAGQEAAPFVLRRSSLPAVIDNNEVQILVTRANVSTATVHFRLYRDYTNNPIWSTTSTPDSQLDGTNCVSYIRGRITTLSSAATVPLNSYTQKKAILNVRDDAGRITKDIKFARRGMAIVTPAASPWAFHGHIAYIETVHANGTITIKEGNSGGNFKIRTISTANIDGYYHPSL